MLLLTPKLVAAFLVAPPPRLAAVRCRTTSIRCSEPPIPPPPEEPPAAAAPPQPAEQRTFTTGWSGAGKYADEDPLPLSFWLFGASPRRSILPILAGPAFCLLTVETFRDGRRPEGKNRSQQGGGAGEARREEEA